MKVLANCTLLAIGVAGGLLFAPQVRWLNEDAHKQEQSEIVKEAADAARGEEFNRTNTNPALFYARPMRLTAYQTNFFAEIGDPTNRFRIEFGFRDDGVVVWRKKQ